MFCLWLSVISVYITYDYSIYIYICDIHVICVCMMLNDNDMHFTLAHAMS